MSYTKENRMSLHQSGAISTTMVYDAMGLKSKEIVGSVTNQFVWDGDDYLGERSSTAGVGTSQISKLYHSVGNVMLDSFTVAFKIQILGPSIQAGSFKDSTS